MIRDANPHDWPAVLALNAASVEQLSPLDEALLAKLAAAATYFRVVEVDGAVGAFLLGFRKGDAYAGAIFGVFSRQANDFLYIDRVVVDARLRGQGLAGRLYDDIAQFAREARIGRLVCEAYTTNETSLRFHARHGFEVAGSQISHGKAVSLLERQILA
ncbi:MAG TPA: GNAT family N-acetyltransferase [Rhizomicrobium sp.]|jgi:hypothetical protein